MNQQIEDRKIIIILYFLTVLFAITTLIFLLNWFDLYTQNIKLKATEQLKIENYQLKQKLQLTR